MLNACKRMVIVYRGEQRAEVKVKVKPNHSSRILHLHELFLSEHGFLVNIHNM